MSVMKKNKFLLLILLSGLLVPAFLLPGCTGMTSIAKPIGRDVLFQVSTLNAILEGVYDGVIPLKELKQHGDFGIGTFEGLDGEMIVLDGEIYQVKSDGKIYRPDDTVKTPFAAVTDFEPDETFMPGGELSFQEFEKLVKEKLPTPNIFYAIKFTGSFSYVKTRSVPGQTKPYPPLVEVTKNQPVFEFGETDGTVVGFFCPEYVNGVNVPGFHLHFLDAAKEGGGHLLDFTLTRGKVEIDYSSQFFMILPEADQFYQANLSDDKSAAMEAAEK